MRCPTVSRVWKIWRAAAVVSPVCTVFAKDASLAKGEGTLEQGVHGNMPRRSIELLNRLGSKTIERHIGLWKAPILLTKERIEAIALGGDEAEVGVLD